MKGKELCGDKSLRSFFNEGKRFLKHFRPLHALIAALLLSLLSACVPSVSSVEPPTFRPLPESLTLLRLDPPGVGAGDATFRLELDNPTPLGYVFSAPAVALKLDGKSVAEAGVMPLPVPAFSTATLTLQFELRPATLGVVLVRQLSNLSSGRGLDLELSGRFSLELPGLFRRDFSVERLLAAVLR
ncbi:hypothetical protein BH24DEI2_BH24DEI2_12600 [soil metagenome]